LLSTFYRVASEAFPGLKNSDGECEGFVIGLVGYPNVGKSSTINRLIQQKKTAVSATPGKTKHFQTLLVNNQVDQKNEFYI
jgi:large subunit GTPase 1